MIKKLGAATAMLLAMLCASPALSQTARLEVDRGALSSLTGTAGSTILVTSYYAGEPVGGVSSAPIPAPPVVYNWTPPVGGVSGCFYPGSPTDPATNLPEPDLDPDVAVQIGSTLDYWCMSAQAVDIRNFGAVQDFAVHTVSHGLTTGSGGSFTASGSNDTNVHFNGGGNFVGFPYQVATTLFTSVTVTNLAQSIPGGCPAPNGVYPATWAAGSPVTDIVLHGVKWCTGWTTQIDPSTGAPLASASISYGIGTDNGPATAVTATGIPPAYPAVNNPIERAINFACLLSAGAGQVTVSDGSGGEPTGEPIDIGQVGGTDPTKVCSGVTFNSAGLQAIAAPAMIGGAPNPIGWDEGYKNLRTVRYLTPASWNGPSYTTPADSYGVGYVANPPATWPTFNVDKIFAQGSLIGIQLSSPMVLAPGQMIYLHNSNIGGAAGSGYLDGLQTIAGIASGYEGCTLPCAATGYLLAGTSATKLGTPPNTQFQFATMKKNTSGQIELDLSSPQLASLTWPSTMYICSTDYPAALLGALNTCSSWTFTSGTVGAGQYGLLGSPVMGVLLGAAYPAGFDPAGFGLSQTTIYAPIPRGLINKGLGTSGINLDGYFSCNNQPGCGIATNYSNADGFGGFTFLNGAVKGWNHYAVFTMGSDSHTYINGGAFVQQGGHPSALGSGISSTIGTLGIRSGIAFQFEGHQGDDLITGGVIVPYNDQAFHTGANTLDVAIHDMHSYNGISPAVISIGAIQSTPLDGPYYNDIEGTFNGTGSFVFSMFDGGSVVVKTTKGVLPNVQISGNWNYKGGAGYADAPLVLISDCPTFRCAQMSNVTGQPQGIDPNQFAATIPPGELGGFLNTGMMSLEDQYGNIGSGWVWNANSLAVMAHYNTAGVNSFDNPGVSAINQTPFSFTGNLKPGSLSFVAAGTICCGATTQINSTSITNAIQPGMAIFGPNIAQGATVATVLPGSSINLSTDLTGFPLAGATYSLPYIDQTASGAVTSGEVITLGSVAGVYPGMNVLAINPTTGLSVVQPTTTVSMVDPTTNKVTLSLPLNSNGYPSGQHFAFSGADYNNPANAPETGFRITAATIFPSAGQAVTISNPSLLPVADGYQIAGIQPANNQIYLDQSTSGYVAPSATGAGPLTVGGVTGKWAGTVTGHDNTIENVRYQTQPISTLLRAGFGITDNGGCVPAGSWIDSWNPLTGTLQINNASNLSVSATCTGDTFTVTPSNYTFQPQDAGQSFSITSAANLFLPPTMPAGWTTTILTPTARPAVTVSELDGMALGSPTINGVNGVPLALAPDDLTGSSTISVTSNGSYAGAAGGLVTYSNYTIPGHAIAAKVDPALQLSFPTSGQTITMAAGVNTLLIRTSAALTTLTVKLPPTPWNGERVDYSLPQGSITSFSVLDSTGAATVGAPAALASPVGGAMVYDGASAKWYRAQ